MNLKNKWTLCGLLSVALSGFIATSGHAAPVTLVHNNQAQATIVTPAAAPAPIQQAAADLQKYIAKMSGVMLPINTDGKAVPSNGLYIGKCEPTEIADLPAEELNAESYAIHQRGGNVFFTGRYPTPAAFAVYSFLENQLGVRWFAPGDEWEFVPPGRPGELAVDVRVELSTPDTSPRVWSGHQWNDSWKAWCLRNKVVVSESVPRREFQNNVYKIFPPSQYGTTHPEYYPLFNGKRRIPASDKEQAWRPCESNPEVQKIIVEHIREFFKKNPKADSFSLGMDDVVYMCGCPNCRAWDASPTDYDKREFSDRHYQFVQHIAQEIKKSNPDKYIGTLVYQITRKPPTMVGKMESNVFGYLTEQNAAWYDPKIKQEDQELTREWKRRLTHLSRYEYLGLGTITPRVYTHHMAEAMELDKSLGMEGMYSESYTFLPHTAPMIWSFAKLQWDSEREIDALQNDFFSKMYGPASKTMAAYYQLLEDSWNEARPEHVGWVSKRLLQQAVSISPQAVHDGMALLEKAKQQAGSDEVRSRIEVVRAGLQYASYPILAYALSQDLIQNSVTTEAQAQAALAKVRELGRLRAERQVFWPAAMQREDLLGENLRGLASLAKLGPEGYLQIGKIGTLESGGVRGALKVLEFYAKEKPVQLRDIAAKMAAELPAEEAAVVRAWDFVQETKPANLLLNGNFEDNAPSTLVAENEWHTEGVPVGWRGWSSTDKGRFKLAPGIGRNGSTAMSLETNSVATTLIQELAVEPGQKYYCMLWAKTDTATEAKQGYLSLRFRTAEGKWNPQTSLEKQVPMLETADWQQLLLQITVPAGVTKLVVMPGIGGGAKKLYLDDAALYRLPADH